MVAGPWPWSRLSLQEFSHGGDASQSGFIQIGEDLLSQMTAQNEARFQDFGGWDTSGTKLQKI